MAVKLWSNRIEQFVDGTGVPRSGAKLFTYVGGSVNTKQTTYTESTGSTPNTNPIVLDSAGRIPQPIWLTTGVSYKFVLAPPTDTDPPTSPIDTLDVITGINDSSASQSEWIAGPAPTFVSTTQFTLVGDQTTNFAKSRRLKFTVTAGTVYGTITASTFGAITTVTVALDSGNLDSGLSAVSYGIVAAANPSIDADLVNRKGAAVASAATTDIWSIAGDFVHVTGSTGPITSFGTAPYAGVERTVILDSTPTITHNATTLQCPGGVNIFGAVGDRFTVRADTTANMVITNYAKASGLPVVGTSVPRSYLAGLTMSTAGASTTMAIAAGQATDSTNSAVMTLASAISKTTSAWAVGTGNGGKLSAAAIANDTTYHFFEIMRLDTGVVDVGFDTSPTSPTMPSNYTLFRRIGSWRTNGSAQWVTIIQDGNLFQLSVPVLETTSANPGTAAVTQTLVNVPTGINVVAILNVTGSGSFTAYLSDLAVADAAPSASSAPLSTTGGGTAASFGAQARVRTNTSAQIRTRISASGGGQQLFICPLGWEDTRGRDA